jgi:hypothetical protein
MQELDEIAAFRWPGRQEQRKAVFLQRVASVQFSYRNPDCLLGVTFSHYRRERPLLKANRNLGAELIDA